MAALDGIADSFRSAARRCSMTARGYQLKLWNQIPRPLPPPAKRVRMFFLQERSVAPLVERECSSF